MEKNTIHFETPPGKQMVISHRRQGTIRYQNDFLAFLGVYALKPDPCRPYRACTSFAGASALPGPAAKVP